MKRQHPRLEDQELRHNPQNRGLTAQDYSFNNMKRSSFILSLLLAPIGLLFGKEKPPYWTPIEFTHDVENSGFVGLEIEHGKMGDKDYARRWHCSPWCDNHESGKHHVMNWLDWMNKNHTYA